MEDHLPRRLVAIFYADVAGYLRLRHRTACSTIRSVSATDYCGVRGPIVSS